MFFKKTKIENKNEGESSMDKSGTKLIEKPKICLFDIDEKISVRIKQKGYNVTQASLGTSYENITYRNRNDAKFCLLNHSIPPNTHEYDIFVVDLKDKPGIPYDEQSNIREFVKGRETYYFQCAYPQTVFDPRPYSAYLLGEGFIQTKETKESILIVFASKVDEQKYVTVVETDSYSGPKYQEKYSNYSFLKNFPIKKSRPGNEIAVLSIPQDLKNLLEKNLSKFHYEVVFNHPTVWDNKSNQNVERNNFLPLMKNNIEEIVSFVEARDSTLLFVFPQLKEKDEILIPLFENILPDIRPEVFPYSTKFLWINHEDYWLPNSRSLLKKKEELEAEYEKKKADIDKEIEDNKNRYSFLHELIKETDEKLVFAVKTFLEWLGFESVKIMDQDKPGYREEDLQVELDKGLLVIEVKGIGGTSKDSECGQISKIKHRREKERQKFDVFALYIVNHERYLPPKERKNPPFSHHQIKDAESDERGLLTTWELFKLYDYIEEGIISKSEARESILKKGLVSFVPSKTVLVGEVNETFHCDYIIILQLKDCRLKTGDKLIISCDDMYKSAIIQNLQENDLNVDEACGCEVGIKLNVPVRKKSKIYLKV
jgi:hypothetical protein